MQIRATASRNVRTTVASALLLGLVAAPGAWAGQPPTFAAGVEVVNLSVTVSDGRHRLVTDLAASDFVVLEDGVRQQVSVFAQRRVPLSVVLLLDTSSSMEGSFQVAQGAAQRFVETLGAEDEAQIVAFNHRVSVLQEFTSDKNALVAAIKSTRPSGATALYNAVYVSLKDLAARGRDGEMRRHAVVLLSDGEDTVSKMSDDMVLDAARRSNISVYAISLRQRGPQALSDMNTKAASFFLSALSRETGGQAQSTTVLSQLEGVYGRIAAELQNQYSLGYVSNNPEGSSRWRKLAVLTPTRASVQVRHKLGYFAGSLARVVRGPSAAVTTASTTPR